MGTYEPRAAAQFSFWAAVSLCVEKHAPRGRDPGTCSGPDMVIYYLRHWFTRYGITSSLPIVLRYKRERDLIKLVRVDYF